MSEHTFAGQTSKIMDIFAGRSEGEFVNVGCDILESEDLSDAVYRTYLSLLAGGWKAPPGGSLSIDDIGTAYLKGFYLPCCIRPVFSGQVDLTNDGLPAHAGVVFFNEGRKQTESPTFISVRRVERFARTIQCPPFAAAKYTGMWMWEDGGGDRIDRRTGLNQSMKTVTAHFAVMSSGVIVPCPDSSKIQKSIGAFLHTCAATINSFADQKHLWQVSTGEPLIGESMMTPLVLGCSPEHIKSLFYARSMPITETGRRRPILHWVQAHRRRIKEGIDVDVEKYLRGITAFEMDGFSFSITNPQKPQKVAA